MFHIVYKLENCRFYVDGKMESIIKLEDVWKRYEMGKAGGLTVLKEADLDIKQGDFIVGGNDGRERHLAPIW